MANPTVMSSSTVRFFATLSTFNTVSLPSFLTTSAAVELPRFKAVLASCCWYFFCMSDSKLLSLLLIFGQFSFGGDLAFKECDARRFFALCFVKKSVYFWCRECRCLLLDSSRWSNACVYFGFVLRLNRKFNIKNIFHVKYNSSSKGVLLVRGLQTRESRSVEEARVSRS